MRFRPIISAIVILSFLLTGGCLFEERFIFQPSRAIIQTPRDFSLRFEDAFFEATDGIRLHGWFVPHPQAQTTLLWFHGNAGNISDRLGNLRLLHEIVRTHIFIFDYRGYGQSQGSPSEQGTYKDARAALYYLRSRKDVQPQRIVFFGRSLGAAVAADLASHERSLALILESPFASIREMARSVFPFLPVGPFLRTRYDVLEKITKVRSPVLVLHGDRDEIVPLEQGKMVFDAASEPKEFYPIPGAHHNDTYATGGKNYFAKLKRFIEKAENRSSESGWES